MQTSDTTGEVYKAIAAVQDKVGVIPKGDDNPFFKSKYAGLPSVVDKVQPILRECGLVVIQTPAYGDLETRVIHLPSGEWIEGNSKLYVSDAPTPQKLGSAITYARRYDYVAILGLICDEDDDGNAASGLDDTTSERKASDKPRRSRRTKAEMETDRAAAAEEAISPPVEEVPLPEGWTDREVCIQAHNDLAERIAKLTPADIQECVVFRNKKGWPMPHAAFEEMAAVVIIKETLTPPPPEQ